MSKEWTLVTRLRSEIFGGGALELDAADRIEFLEAELIEWHKARDSWCEAYTEQRDDANALVKRCAELEAALKEGRSANGA